jgi:ribonuclease HI
MLYISARYSSSVLDGGWASIIDDGTAVREFCGGCRKASEGRMALSGMIQALHSLGHLEAGARLNIVTDNKLLAEGLGGKVIAWKAKGWRTKAGLWIPHNELWRRILKLLARFEFRIEHDPHPDEDSLLSRAGFLCRTGQIYDKPLRLFVDGSYLPGLRAGGWGAVVDDHGEVVEASGSMIVADNNAMELIAVIRGLEMLPDRRDVVVYSDSEYVRLGVGKMKARKENNWRHTSGVRVTHYQWWQKLDELLTKIGVRIEWVKGHSGIEHNETADRLAGKAAREGVIERMTGVGRIEAMAS